MDRVKLYEEFRLIERTEAEVNGVWKGAHLLLFFLAFVFGSFCTFCFHLLMYLFDEKCVLFPKLLSLTSLRQNIIFEFIPDDKEAADSLPVDFVSTQWVEKSACLLPTYVPLVSGIFGLVWTTMFLMCSTGSRVLTGLQRPWRVLPPVFVFSLAMGSLCVYTSAVTHYGLQELCLKLSEITGSTTCTYTVNVATLAYERRIRGVYQATRLTIYSAWLHTGCWLLSALLALIRVIFAIDFKLVRVSVELHGNIDRMLERHERHIRTISPDSLEARHSSSTFKYATSAVRTHFKTKEFHAKDLNTGIQTRKENEEEGDLLYFSDLPAVKSENSLLSPEMIKLNQLETTPDEPDNFYQYIVKKLYNALDAMDSVGHSIDKKIVTESSTESELMSETLVPITRQYGQPRIQSMSSSDLLVQPRENTSEDRAEVLEIIKAIKKYILELTHKNISKETLLPVYINPVEFESTINIASDMKEALKEKSAKLAVAEEEPSTSKGIKERKLKPNLKRVGVQTDLTLREKPLTVHIDSKTNIFSSKTILESSRVLMVDKSTQTEKDKQE